MTYLQLAQEECGRKQVLAAVRVVAAMDFRVAVQATTPLLDECIGFWGSGDWRCDTRDTWGPVTTMALIAHEGWSSLEQVVSSRSMRHMTVRAVVTDWTMIVHKGPTLLHMAGVASLDYGIIFHQASSRRAVYIVTIRTTYLSFHNRMMRRFVYLCALCLVATETNFGLRTLIEYIVAFSMQGVT